MGRPLIHRSPIPGLGISAGITITLLSLVVLLPIGALLLKGAVLIAAGREADAELLIAKTETVLKRLP